MRALVTGGAGFIGSHLVERLLARGDSIRVLDDLSTGRREAVAPGAEFKEGDVRDARAVAEAVGGAEVVFHLAAVVSVERSLAEPGLTTEVNAGGTLTVLEEARRAGAGRVILASSCAVYGETPEGPIGESAPRVPLSPYAASKAVAEDLCRASRSLGGPEAVALRFFNVYGPRQDPASPYAAVVPRFMEAARAGRPATICGDGLQTRDFVYVGDVVEAMLRAAAAPSAAVEPLNIASGSAVTVLSLLEAVEEAAGRRIERVFAPVRRGEVRHSRADISRAASAIGWSPAVSLREGLGRVLALLRNAGGLPAPRAPRPRLRPRRP